MDMASAECAPGMERRGVERCLWRSHIRVAEHVVKHVGLVVEAAQMLEFEAQHHRTVGPDIERDVLHERLDVADRQGEALVLVLDLQDVLDALLVIDVVAHLALDRPVVGEAIRSLASR